MKPLLFAALITLSATTGAFAKDVNKVSYRVMQNFTSDFTEAKQVTWTVKSNFTKAEFMYNGEKMEAFYNPNGEMIGTSKKITLEQLPTNAKRTFAKRYDGYTVKEAIRFEGVSESAYYISAENDKEAVILKVSDDTSVSVWQRNRKN